MKAVSGAVQSLDRQLHGLQERAQIGVIAGHSVERGKRSKMPRRRCVRSAGTGEGSTATRRSGESWREASGVSVETPRSGLEPAAKGERRRVTGSAAMVNRARRARVRGGSPATSRVAEVVEAERLRLGRGGVARATTRRGRWALVEARTVRRVATIVEVRPVHPVT
ncbi:hypothetical protein Emag_007189 [Eimeria magna]